MGSISDMPSVHSDKSTSSALSESKPEGQGQGQKRSAEFAGLKPDGHRPMKSVKRRASKACQCCRSRKVRCNVVEHGAPCTNCRLDEVECIVSESKRKKKWANDNNNNTKGKPTVNKVQLDKARTPSVATSVNVPQELLQRRSIGEHVPHALYQDLDKDMGTSPSSFGSPGMLMNTQPIPQRQASIPILPNIMSPAMFNGFSLPPYMKPIPSRWGSEEISYLEKRGALTIPESPLRDELLRCYIEFVHPYMPLVDIHETVRIMSLQEDSKPISLLLFQAMMFAGVAFVDNHHLKAAGFSTRKDARREFFSRTRLLYDFDYEQDRIALIQALLLMTYWYETPDDQKDSHHWMGIAVSLCHTIGLHRNPEANIMDADRRKLWKRIWWSTYMRDRLIALGMRRPTRIKDTDFDVPMLTLDDFEDANRVGGPIRALAGCRFLRDREMQRKLAIMCIEKAKLCVCISHVLTAQYSVLHSNDTADAGAGSTRTTMMLVANRLKHQADQVRSCNHELQQWKCELPEEAEYVMPSWYDTDVSEATIVLNRSLLHMVYYATLSALHRPQVLPNTSMPPAATESASVKSSKRAVRLAAAEITGIANTLNNLDLVRYFPTTGITVILPAIIIHLLDIKAPDEATRRSSLQGFCQCMQVMGKLRDIYAAADFSTAFLEAAIRKAEITLPQKSDEVKEPRNVITSAQGLVDAGRRMHLVPSGLQSHALTPPPDDGRTPTAMGNNGDVSGDSGSTSTNSCGSGSSSSSSSRTGASDYDKLSDEEISRRLSNYLATTPPEEAAGGQHDNVDDMFDATAIFGQDNMDIDFDSLLNLDAAGEGFPLDDGAFAAMSGGENGGINLDVDWMRGMRSDAIVMPV